MQFRIAAVDLVSNTCFPALAAEELGYFKSEGLDARIELVAMLGATKALRQGSADAMIAGSVFDLLTEFPNWQGAKIVVGAFAGHAVAARGSRQSCRQARRSERTQGFTHHRR